MLLDETFALVISFVTPAGTTVVLANVHIHPGNGRAPKVRELTQTVVPSDFSQVALPRLGVILTLAEEKRARGGIEVLRLGGCPLASGEVGRSGHRNDLGVVRAKFITSRVMLQSILDAAILLAAFSTPRSTVFDPRPEVTLVVLLPSPKMDTPVLSVWNK